MSVIEDTPEPLVWHFAGVEFDDTTWELRVGDLLVDVEQKPLEVLAVLLNRAGRVVSQVDIMDGVWPSRPVCNATVSNNVNKIRKALGEPGREVIQTAKSGYRISVPVERGPSRHLPKQLPRFTAGAPVPGRLSWKLAERLGGSKHNEVWIAEHGDTQERRVFKFCVHTRQLAAMRQELAVSRHLEQALGQRPDLMLVQDCNLDQAPYYLELPLGGVNLRAWAAKHGGIGNVPMEVRLELVACLADALSVAHSVGVLHKDVKPDNILIEEEPGEKPLLKLCDFGVSKLDNAAKLKELLVTQGGSGDHAVLGGLSGTLIYMAPELYGGAASSTKSDIYAAGVILYQLVLGQLSSPPATGWQSQVEDEALRETIASAIDGDPNKRLPSAQMLSEQIRDLPRRRAEKEAVRRRDEAAARLRRSLEKARARRRAWGLLSVVSLIALIVCAAFYIREHRQYQAAKAMSAYIINDVMAREDPLYYGGTPDMSFIEPVMQSEPIGVMELATAQRTVEYDEHLFGKKDRRTVASDIELAKALASVGRLAEASSVLEQAEQSEQSLGSPPDEKLNLDAMYVKAMLLGLNKQLQQSHNLYEQLQIICNLETNCDMDFRSRVSFRLAQLTLDLGQYKEAERLDRNLIERSAQNFGGGEVTMAARVQLGAALLKQDRFAEAKDSLSTAEDWFTRNVGPNDFTAITAMQYLAMVAGGQGRWDEALRWRQQALHGIETVTGRSSREAVMATVLLARDALHAGNLDEALNEARRATDTGVSALSPSSTATLAARLTLAQALLRKGNTLDERQPDIEALLTPADPRTATSDPGLQGLIWFLRAEQAYSKGLSVDAKNYAEQARELLARAASEADLAELKTFVADLGKG